MILVKKLVFLCQTLVCLSPWGLILSCMIGFINVLIDSLISLQNSYIFLNFKCLSAIGLILGFLGHLIVTCSLWMSPRSWFASWLELVFWRNHSKHQFSLVLACLLQSFFSIALGYLALEKQYLLSIEHRLCCLVYKMKRVHCLFIQNRKVKGIFI